MKLFNIHSLLRIFFLILCCFMFLTACSDNEGGTPIRKAKDGGETPQMVADNQRQCWQESLLKMFYKNLGAQTSSVYKTFQNDKTVYAAMMIMFSVWMAFQILRHVSATAPESLGEFWTRVLQQGFLCVVCGILASSTDQIIYALNNFVFPVFVTMLQFASSVMDTLSKANPNSNLTGLQLVTEGGESNDVICEVYTHFISQCKLGSTSLNFSVSGGMPSAPIDLMSCMACSVSDRLSIGYILAYKLFTMSTILSFVVGFLIIVTFTIAKLTFALYLIDSIFRLNMIMIIIPFLILFCAFSQTRKWTVTGFKFIINSSAIILCLALLVSMSIVAMQEIMLDHRLGFDFANQEKYYNFGVVPMAMIFIGFMMIKISSMAVELAGNLVGGKGETKFQKAVAAVMMAPIGLAFSVATGLRNFINSWDFFGLVKGGNDSGQKIQDQIQKNLNTLAGNDEGKQ